MLLERLKLDVKSSMSLAKESNSYLALLKHEITESPDMDIRSFVQLISEGRRRTPRVMVIIALGELSFSALLLFMGLVLIFPTFFSYADPRVMLDYFSTQLSFIAPGTIQATLILIVDFTVSVIMLLSAFQLIRIASNNLKEAGLTVSDAN